MIWSLGIPVDLSHISDDQKACPESTHVNFNNFQGMKPCIIPKKKKNLLTQEISKDITTCLWRKTTMY